MTSARRGPGGAGGGREPARRRSGAAAAERSAAPGMLPEPKYDRFRDEPLTAPMPSPAPAPCPAAGEEPEPGTTFCALLPRMPQWKFPGPAGFLGRGPAGAGRELSAPARAGGTAAAGAPSALAAVLGACEPLCAAPCSLPAGGRPRGAAAGAAGRAARAEAARPGGEEWSRKGSFIRKPAQGWLHPDERVLGPGVSYIVRVSPEPGPPRRGRALSPRPHACPCPGLSGSRRSSRRLRAEPAARVPRVPQPRLPQGRLRRRGRTVAASPGPRGRCPGAAAARAHGAERGCDRGRGDAVRARPGGCPGQPPPAHAACDRFAPSRAARPRYCPRCLARPWRDGAASRTGLGRGGSRGGGAFWAGEPASGPSSSQPLRGHRKP